MQSYYAELIDMMELYAMYKGKIYRCTGASRMGDVWLAKDWTRQNGYDLRVYVNEIEKWFRKAPVDMTQFAA